MIAADPHPSGVLPPVTAKQAHTGCGPAAQAPVGLFDSGVGGLSVLRDVRALLPAESLMYVADSRHAPYGIRSRRDIMERSCRLTECLANAGAKAVVIACNTATAAAAAELRRRFPLPIIGMEPAIKPAVAASRNGVIGVLATEGTLESARFSALLSRYAYERRIITRPCPGLVEAVEAGEEDSPRTGLLLERYLAPVLEAGADTIILGCTHFSFLRPQLERRLPRHVALMETGVAVARQLQRRLAVADLLNRGDDTAAPRYLTSGSTDSLRRFLARHGLPGTDVGVLREEPGREAIPAPTGVQSSSCGRRDR